MYRSFRVEKRFSRLYITTSSRFHIWRTTGLWLRVYVFNFIYIYNIIICSLAEIYYAGLPVMRFFSSVHYILVSILPIYIYMWPLPEVRLVTNALIHAHVDSTQSYIITATCTTKLNNTDYQRCSDKLNYDYHSHRFTTIFLKVFPPPLLVDKLIRTEEFTIYYLNIIIRCQTLVYHPRWIISPGKYISEYNLYRIHILDCKFMFTAVCVYFYYEEGDIF